MCTPELHDTLAEIQAYTISTPRKSNVYNIVYILTIMRQIAMVRMYTKLSQWWAYGIQASDSKGVEK